MANKYTGTPQEDWFKRFMARGYRESGKMAATEAQRRLIDLSLDDIRSAQRGLDAMADRFEQDGFDTAASLVRDSIAFLDDITWLDFTIDLEEDEPDTENTNVVIT